MSGTRSFINGQQVVGEMIGCVHRDLNNKIEAERINNNQKLAAIQSVLGIQSIGKSPAVAASSDVAIATSGTYTPPITASSESKQV